MFKVLKGAPPYGGIGIETREQEIVDAWKGRYCVRK